MFHTEFLTEVNDSNKYCQQQYLSLKMTEMCVFKESEGLAGARQVHELHQAAFMSLPTWTMALEHGHALQVVSGLTQTSWSGNNKEQECWIGAQLIQTFQGSCI